MAFPFRSCAVFVIVSAAELLPPAVAADTEKQRRRDDPAERAWVEVRSEPVRVFSDAGECGGSGQFGGERRRWRAVSNTAAGNRRRTPSISTARQRCRTRSASSGLRARIESIASASSAVM